MCCCFFGDCLVLLHHFHDAAIAFDPAWVLLGSWLSDSATTFMVLSEAPRLPGASRSLNGDTFGFGVLVLDTWALAPVLGIMGGTGDAPNCLVDVVAVHDCML